MKRILYFIYGVIFTAIILISTQLVIANPTKIENVSGVTEVNGVRYETVWVAGNRFLVFSNSSGSDIEVFSY